MIGLNDASIDMEAVRQYHRQRDAKRQLKSEADRLTWLTRTRDTIMRLAPDYPEIERVYLFGSLMQPGRFRPDSDLDVAVLSSTVEAESVFWRALEQALQRDVDVRPYIGAIVDAVAWFGEQVYERESDHS